MNAHQMRSIRPSLHHLEAALVMLVCGHLVFLTWAFGGMRIWGQWVSFCLSAVALIVSLLPRKYVSVAGGAEFRVSTRDRLARLPIFWIGFVLLVYILIQALNPAWIYQTDGKNWWMRQLPTTHWLPQGVDVPVGKSGPWRMLLIYISVWMSLCAVWVGFTARQSVYGLVLTVAVNGMLVGLFGLIQRFWGNGKIFWVFESPNALFFGPFIYKNHAGAYMILALATNCGVAGWYYLRGQRRLDKSTPSGVFIFSAICLTVSVLLSYARGATVIAFVFIGLFMLVYVVHQFLARRSAPGLLVGMILVVLFGCFVYSGIRTLHSQEAWVRIRHGLARRDTSLKEREQVTLAATEMLRDSWIRGVGAGGFKFLFPIYQHRYPEIQTYRGRAMYWEHAHNDLVQFPIEFGAIGTLLLLSVGAIWVIMLLRRRFWRNPLSLCVVGGVVMLTGYAWWDFPFQCPAILHTWCTLWVTAILWAEFEQFGGPLRFSGRSV